MSPPDGLVAQLRWLALYYGFTCLSVVLAVISATSLRFSETAMATTGIVVLTGFLLWGYRGRRYRLPVDVMGASALFVVGLQLGTPVRCLAIFSAIVVFRALYGRGVDVWFAGLLQCSAFAAALILPRGGTDLAGLVEVALPALLLLIAGPIVNTVTRTLAEHERNAAHASAMGDTAAALLAAGDPVRIAQTAVATAGAVLPAGVGAGMSVLLVREDALVVAANDNSVGAPSVGGRLPLRAVPQGVLDRLDGAHPFFGYGLEVRDGGLTRQVNLGGEPMLYVPLTCRGQVRGLMVVPHPPAIHGSAQCECISVLEVLGSHTALALDSAILTEDVIRSETRFRSLVQNCTDVITVVDQTGIVRYLSPTVTRVLGYAPVALTNSRFDRIVHPDDFAQWIEFFREVVQGRPRHSVSCRLHHRNRGWRYTEIVAANCLSEPSVAGVVLDIRDVSDRKVLEEELVHRASHDPLTALPNRTLFLDRVREVVSRAERPDSLALLFIDLDGFKLINDRFGHAVGDGVLQHVARSLTDCLRPNDMAARLSGDEFAVLVGDLSSQEEASHIADRVLEALAVPCTVQQQELTVRASIGVAIGGAGVEDAEDLVHRADLAMYTAKGHGKNRVEVFEPNAYASLSGRRQLQADLQWAVLRNEFEVRYQPVVRLRDGRITSAEALVRWQHPEKGLLGPDQFIGLAEESDLIADVFEVVLRNAAEQALEWQKISPEPISVNVNLSAVQLHQPELVDHVSRVLADVGLPPELLTLEITESVLVDDLQQACETLATIRQQGVRVAIDDFGTGYSSLQYLSRLPIDTLKIDKIFLKGVATGESAALARTIVELGLRMGLPTVAEGVEKAEQRDALRDLGCTHGQGYLFSRPVSGDRLAALIAGGPLTSAPPAGPMKVA